MQTNSRKDMLRGLAIGWSELNSSDSRWRRLLRGSFPPTPAVLKRIVVSGPPKVLYGTGIWCDGSSLIRLGFLVQT